MPLWADRIAAHATLPIFLAIRPLSYECPIRSDQFRAMGVLSRGEGTTMSSLPESVHDQVMAAVAQAQSDAERHADFGSTIGKDFDFDPPVAFNARFASQFPPARRYDASPLTRSAILHEGSRIRPEATEEEVTSFLYLVNAWGYGKTGYGHSRTTRVAEGFYESALRAIEILHDRSDDIAPITAYFHLNNRGHVKGWGPAFFTKFLMFVDPANSGDKDLDRLHAVVLDRLTATRANGFLPEGLNSSRPRKGALLGRFGQSGWTTVQYAYYLSLLSALARQAPFVDDPMKVERVLFQRQRDSH